MSEKDERDRGGVRVSTDSGAVNVRIPAAVVAALKATFTSRALIILVAVTGLGSGPVMTAVTGAETTQATDVLAEELTVVRATLEDILVEMRRARLEAKTSRGAPLTFDDLRGVAGEATPSVDEESSDSPATPPDSPAEETFEEAPP